MWLTVQERHTAEYCLFFSWACTLIREKTLHSRSQELAVPYQPHSATLKRPSHWLNPLCPVSWLDEHKCTSCKEYPQKKDDKVYDSVAQSPPASDSGVLVFTPGRLISNVIRWTIFELGFRMAGGYSQHDLREERNGPSGVSWGGPSKSWCSTNCDEEAEILGGQGAPGKQHRG